MTDALGEATVEVTTDLLATIRRRADIDVRSADDFGEGIWLARVRHAALCPGDNGMQEIVVTDPNTPIKFQPWRDA